MAAAEVPLTIDVDGTAVSGVYARPDHPAATLVVAHGAGAGMEHPFLRGFTTALNDAGEKVPAAFATKVVRDHRLDPGASLVRTYDLPAGVATIEARVELRLVPPPLAAKIGIEDTKEAEPRVVLTATGG